jgi:hypothetical protein
MKLALVFSGQPRFFENTAYSSIKKHLIDKHECDVYAHFWFSPDSNTKYETALWSGLGELTFPSDTVDRFTKLYKPLNIQYNTPVLNSEIKNTYLRSNSPRSAYNVSSKYTSIKLSFKLIENIEKYDFIVNIRSDLVIFDIPDITAFSTEKIYLFEQEKERNILNDNINFIPPKYAHIFYNAIDNFDLLYNNGTLYNAEELYYSTFEYNNLLDKCVITPRTKGVFGFDRGNKIHRCWE